MNPAWSTPNYRTRGVNERAYCEKFNEFTKTILTLTSDSRRDALSKIFKPHRDVRSSSYSVAIDRMRPSKLFQLINSSWFRFVRLTTKIARVNYSSVSYIAAHLYTVQLNVSSISAYNTMSLLRVAVSNAACATAIYTVTTSQEASHVWIKSMKWYSGSAL